MTSVDICQYNFKMWLQDKCSSHAGSIVNNFISGAIHAEYIPEKRTFVIYPDKKEYRKSDITVALDNPPALERLIDEMLAVNSGRVFSQDELNFF